MHKQTITEAHKRARAAGGALASERSLTIVTMLKSGNGPYERGGGRSRSIVDPELDSSARSGRLDRPWRGSLLGSWLGADSAPCSRRPIDDHRRIRIDLSIKKRS